MAPTSPPRRVLARKRCGAGARRRATVRAVAGLRCERGQASVELVALLPLVGVAIVLLWQAVLAGATVWLGGGAARAAARAVAVDADPVLAARAALPERFERGLRVRREQDGAVAVVLRIPSVVGGRSLGTVRTRAHYEAQR